MIEHGSLLKPSPARLKILSLLTGIPLTLAPAWAQSSSSLPDTPGPHLTGSLSRSVSVLVIQVPRTRATAPDPRSHADDETRKRKWTLSIDPGEVTPRLDARDKMKFWLHEEMRPTASLPAFVAAGYGQLVLNDPKFGANSGAFGERLGAAFLRDATMRFLVSSAIPAIDGEDPRYYRAESGGILRRAGWAVEQTFVDWRDSGRRTFNFSDIFGHLAAASLTPAYYPSASRSAEVVMRTWGTSIAGSAANNLFLEFLPCVVHRWPRTRRFWLPERHRRS
jgi:hypothetical protein